MHTLTLPNVAHTKNTIVCNNADHCHADPHIDIVYFHFPGHIAIVEHEQNSGVFVLKLDDDLYCGISAAETMQLIQEKIS